MKETEINRKIQEEGWIRIRMIQEMAGWPREHVEATMDRLNGKLTSDEGVKILEREVHEANKVTEQMWSMFADLELLVNGIGKVLEIITNFMPSSVEIIEPADFVRGRTAELSGALNDLIGKMHHQDMAVKKLFAIKKMLEKQLEASKQTGK